MEKENKITAARLEKVMQGFKSPAFETQNKITTEGIKEAVLGSETAVFSAKRALTLGLEFDMDAMDIAVAIFTAGAAAGYALAKDEEKQ